MVRIIKLIICLVLFSELSWAGWDHSTPGVLIAGDSWAMFLCHNRSFEWVWAGQNVKAKMHEGCYATIRPGIRAQKWSGSRQDKSTRSLIKRDRSIKILVLSLGGNDLINRAHKNMTFVEEQMMLQNIFKDIHTTVSVYKRIRPDIKIVVSGYDFPRFSADHKIPAYRNAYRDMGQPTPAELNQFLLNFSQYMTRLNETENVFYVHHLGLMHYYFGDQENNLLPGQTLNPELIAHPNQPKAYGGVLSLRSPDEAMLPIYRSISDAFHLNIIGFYYLALHMHNLYLASWLEGN